MIYLLLLLASLTFICWIYGLGIFASLFVLLFALIVGYAVLVQENSKK